MKLSLLCVFFGSLKFALAASAPPLIGVGYEPGTNHQKELFRFKSTDTVEGNLKKITSQFTSLDGKELVSEEITVTGGKLTSYRIHHKQTNEEGALDVASGKLLFSYTKEGKTTTDDEKAPNDLTIGPLIVDHMQAHWEELLKGDSIKVRLAVLDRKETVGFKIFKEAESTRDGKATITLQMKPTSIFIAALVDPIHFIFSKETKEILEIDGRTLPKREVGGKFKDLDPEILYHVADK